MMVRPQQQRPEPPQTISRDPRETAVDLWIARELRRGYNRTLSEPVPEDLLRLIERFPPRP